MAASKLKIVTVCTIAGLLISGVFGAGAAVWTLSEILSEKAEKKETKELDIRIARNSQTIMMQLLDQINEIKRKAKHNGGLTLDDREQIEYLRKELERHRK